MCLWRGAWVKTWPPAFAVLKNKNKNNCWCVYAPGNLQIGWGIISSVSREGGRLGAERGSNGHAAFICHRSAGLIWSRNELGGGNLTQMACWSPPLQWAPLSRLLKVERTLRLLHSLTVSGQHRTGKSGDAGPHSGTDRHDAEGPRDMSYRKSTMRRPLLTFSSLLTWSSWWQTYTGSFQCQDGVIQVYMGLILAGVYRSKGESTLHVGWHTHTHTHFLFIFHMFSIVVEVFKVVAVCT